MTITPLRLLLADDDQDDCDLFADAIKDSPLLAGLTIVNDGEKLMQLLTEKNTHLPDLLFLDLNMPKKNGFQCLQEIKQNDHIKQLPVVIFSTSLDAETASRLYQNGAWHYIRKPNEFVKLRNVISNALAHAEQAKTNRPDMADFVLEP